MGRNSEIARGLRNGVSAFVLAWAGAAQALPVYSGNAQIGGNGASLPIVTTSSPTQLNVDISAARTIMDWTSH